MAQGVYNAYPNNFITKSEGNTVKELPRKGNVSILVILIIML